MYPVVIFIIQELPRTFTVAAKQRKKTGTMPIGLVVGAVPAVSEVMKLLEGSVTKALGYQSGDPLQTLFCVPAGLRRLVH